jgi:short-chain fatty acids transporter
MPTMHFHSNTNAQIFRVDSFAKRLWQSIITACHRGIPDAFTFCLLLTVLAFFAGYRSLEPTTPLAEDRIVKIIKAWYGGFINDRYIAFAFQMCLIVVTGSVIAHTPGCRRLINRIAEWAAGRAASNIAGSALATARVATPRRAVVTVAAIAVLSGSIHWGFSLVVSANLALAVHRASALVQGRHPIRLSVLVAAAYMGLIVWHCGLSGSAPLLANDGKPLDVLQTPLLEFYQAVGQAGPGDKQTISIQATMFSFANIAALLAAVACILIFFAWIGPRSCQSVTPVARTQVTQNDPEADPAFRTLAASAWHRLGWLMTLTVTVAGIALLVIKGREGFLKNYTVELYTFSCLILGMFLHASPAQFSKAVSQRVSDIGPMIIQFPFYWGILGIMKDCDTADMISKATQAWMPTSTDGFYWSTYLSAAALNIFVPSGGGQWHIQSPVVFDMAANFANESTAFANGLVHLPFCDPTTLSWIPEYIRTHHSLEAGRLVLCVAYGDQVTNLMQPFWILPILPIVRLRERDVLSVTLLLLPVLLLVYGAVVCYAPLSWDHVAEWWKATTETALSYIR